MLFVETWQINEGVYNVQSWALLSQFISSSGRPLTPDLSSVGADIIVSIIGFSGHQVTDVCEATRGNGSYATAQVLNEMDNVNI